MCYAHINDTTIEAWQKTKKLYPCVIKTMLPYATLNDWLQINKKTGISTFESFKPKNESKCLIEEAHYQVRNLVIDSILLLLGAKGEFHNSSFKEKYKLVHTLLKEKQA